MNSTEENPLVSVICAWYNRADYIHDTLDSLLNQDFDNYEIIIVNDGSKDPRVKDILDSYVNPKLIIIHQENMGFVAAIRRAADSASGVYIAVQGAGDVSLPGRLRLQSDFLLSNPDFGIIGCKRHETMIGGEANGVTTIEGVSGEHSLEDLLYGKNPFTHGEVMFRRDIYKKVGGYRVFFKYAQDRDLWIRMSSYTKPYVLKEVLYIRRSFAEDGISLNKEKLLIQQAFSIYARQCHHDKLIYGYDFVEKFGIYAGLFRKPSSSFAKAISVVALKSIYTESFDDAIDFSRYAISEKLSAYPIITYVAARLSSRFFLFRKIIKSILSKRRDSKKWESLH